MNKYYSEMTLCGEIHYLVITPKNRYFRSQTGEWVESVQNPDDSFSEWLPCTKRDATNNNKKPLPVS